MTKTSFQDMWTQHPEGWEAWSINNTTEQDSTSHEAKGLRTASCTRAHRIE